MFMSNVGNTLNQLHRHEEALKMYEKVFELGSRVWGSEHEQTLLSMYYIGYSLNELERYEEARSILRKCSFFDRAPWGVVRVKMLLIR
jgi:tetratricopeptide (TPR) repeat protein